ncbi:MAG: polysaccharide deacetylase family protein [Proteobacteria bacterium]|nr:polysaccharide deacetylase family protein [Pseudomonadota bacterium]
MSNGRFVLQFHGVSKHKYPNIPEDIQPQLTVVSFRAVLGWIRKRFSFLTPNEFLESNKSGVLLTFDDGLANNYANVLPVLVEFDAPAIFFVSTQHVGSPRDWLPATRNAVLRHWKSEEFVPRDIAADFCDGMSRDQLALSARNPLLTIGSHTVSHPFLTQCSNEELLFELVESKRFLEEVIQQTVTLFAYPAGDYNRSVAETVRAAGYDAAFSENSRNVGFPVLEIPRVGIYSASLAYVSAKLSGLHRRPIGRPPLQV